MGINSFTKQEKVAYDDVIEGFKDMLAMTKTVEVYKGLDDTAMERANNTIYRPMPYIATSYNGMDQTDNFRGVTQLQVPATIGNWKSVPFEMDVLEMRDAMQEQSFKESAFQRLASDVNVSILDTIVRTATIIVRRTGSATGFDDVAQIKTAMNRVGVPFDKRFLALSGTDYNNMASNLAQRQTLSDKTLTAYEQARVGNIAGFETLELDYSQTLTANNATGVTVNGDGQTDVPTTLNTDQTKRDNRFGYLQITVGGGTVKAGDAFTITGVNEVHHITKQDTGKLKTFRIMEQISGSTGGSGTYKIYPQIVSGAGGSQAELAYKNVTATPATGATLTFLNTTTTEVSPFFYKGAIELLPGRQVVDPKKAMSSTLSDVGLQIVMTKDEDINTLRTKIRFDIFWGVCNRNPQMTGLLIANQ